MSDSSQDKILYQLKRLGPLSAKDLGQHLGMTTMGARQHLAQLEALALTRMLPEEPQKRGRPIRRWKLTEAGHRRFPDAHAQVTSELLISITDLLGDEALDQLIKERTRTTLRHYSEQLSAYETLEEKLNVLAELRSAEGYMAEIEQNEAGYSLIEHHCPICIAAKTCQGFCQSELDVFQILLEGLATVARDEHLIKGARRCSYSITPAL